MSLQRLVITFKPGGLARSGLTQALEALEAGAECVGTSGFTTREDVLLTTTSPDAATQVKGA